MYDVIFFIISISRQNKINSNLLYNFHFINLLKCIIILYAFRNITSKYSFCCIVVCYLFLFKWILHFKMNNKSAANNSRWPAVITGHFLVFCYFHWSFWRILVHFVSFSCLIVSRERYMLPYESLFDTLAPGMLPTKNARYKNSNDFRFLIAWFSSKAMSLCTGMRKTCMFSVVPVYNLLWILNSDLKIANLKMADKHVNK